MGNNLHKSASSSENNEPTPAIVALTESDVEIIKRTWKIPAENVSEKRNFLHNAARLSKILFHYFIEYS